MNRALKTTLIFSLILLGFNSNQLLSNIPGITGRGTSDSPYLINNDNGTTPLAKLNKIAKWVNKDTSLPDAWNRTWESVSKYFKLMTDIGTNSGNAFTRIIGTYASPFRGIFDGNGYKIELNIERRRGIDVGLFGYATNATIKNLTVTGTVKGYSSVAGILGNGTAVTIDHCTNLAEVVGIGYVDLYFNTGDITLQSSKITTNSSYIDIGPGGPTDPPDHFWYKYSGPCAGIVGFGTQGTIVRHCVNSGLITADYEAGGIVGQGDNSADISYCVNLGTVKSIYIGYSAGGIVAKGANSILHCSNSGYIFSNQGIAGGIIGNNSKSYSVLMNCLNTGVVECSNQVGAISGTNNTTSSIVNNFYDKQMCPFGSISGQDYTTNNKAVGKYTYEVCALNLGSNWKSGTSNSSNSAYYYPTLLDAGNSYIGNNNSYNNVHLEHVAASVLFLHNPYENTSDVQTSFFRTTKHTQGAVSWISTTGRMSYQSSWPGNSRTDIWLSQGFAGSDTMIVRCFAFSREVPLTVNNTIYKTNVAEELHYGAFTISEIMPNIITENATMNVTVANECNLNVSIYDINGAKVMNVYDNYVVENSTVKIDFNNLSNLSTGTYSVVVSSGNNVTVRKFIKK
jgi:hypothetical protein